MSGNEDNLIQRITENRQAHLNLTGGTIGRNILGWRISFDGVG